MTFKNEVIRAIREYFPDADLEIHERRDTILEIRAILGEDIFIEIYANFLTTKKVMH